MDWRSNHLSLIRNVILKLVTNYIINSRITIALGVIVILFLCISCGDKPAITEAITNRSEMPRLKVDEITTIISDSGITRYRITAKVWCVYDKAAEPYWDFPEGLHLERFDENYNTDAKIDCKRARYYESRRLWELNDSVRATNLQGDQFATQQLFWSQNEERIYSDSAIVVTQRDKKIMGEGFESNQSMTRYTIRKTKGIIPVESGEGL